LDLIAAYRWVHDSMSPVGCLPRSTQVDRQCSVTRTTALPSCHRCDFL